MIVSPEGILHKPDFSHLAREITTPLFLQVFFPILMIVVGKYRIINKEKTRYSIEHSTVHLPIHFPNF